MGEIGSLIAMRPVTFFIVLTFAVLLLPSIVIPIWYNMTKKLEHNVRLEATSDHHQLIAKVEDASRLILPINSSSINLARVLVPFINNGDKLLFSDILTKVAPTLFEAQLIMPEIIQASYIGLDGLFFSYSIQNDQIVAMYSNSSYANDHYTWYTQLVKPNSGELYGEAKATKPLIVVNETWFKQAMNSSNGSASLGFSWISINGKERTNVFLDTARLGVTGAVSLGFSVRKLMEYFSSTNHMGASFYLTTISDGKVLMRQGFKEANINISGGKALVYDRDHKYIGEIQCNTTNYKNATNVGGTILDIGGTNAIFYCSSIDVAMVPMVYILAFPNTGLVNFVHKHTHVALILLCVMMVAMVISVFAFVAMIVRAAWREVHLCAAYMREMEKIAQAERKSMKQSLAFASANHDVRGYLACMKGLIDLSYADLPPSSELASNLKKMDTCAEDLLELVNSILDFSKIEAGKMQLEEKEFNLAQLLEDVADLYYPVAMKKGVEVILDPCDGSILRHPLVKGDRSKLKQILSNLLSNAVKFTSQGHIYIKCHANKPSLENSIIASHRNYNMLNRLLRFFYRNKRAYNDLEEMKTIQQDPNYLEFVFQVEDTGPGIPMEKRSSIFEDFVQVKETSAGHVGTGLGLGIVQSLVRLMGGDIGIIDKANDEQGVCFKFNIFLRVQEEGAPMGSPRQEDLEHKEVNNPSSGLGTCVRSPRGERSLVILLIQNDARTGMVHRYMESLGINVKVINHGKQLSNTLKKIKLKITEPQHNSSLSGRFDSAVAHYLSSGSESGCRGGPKLLPLNLMEGTDEVLPMYRRSRIRGSMKCILLVVDCNAGDDFQKLQRSVSEFRRDLYMTCTKVVWLDRPDTRKAHFKGLQDVSLPSTDHIISEPLHGSRLSMIIRLLPEFGGDIVRSPTKDGRNLNFSTGVLPSNTQLEGEEEIDESNNGEIKPSKKKRILSFSSSSDSAHEHEVPQMLRSSSREKSISKIIITQIGEIQEIFSADAQRSVEQKNSPLEGKKILIVEDQKIQRMLAEKCVTRLGAEAQTCENGKEAFEVVNKALSTLLSGGNSKFPYDCILMDCQMPMMDGFEATMRIREEEEKYGIHIPIIALTSHEVDGDEGKKIAEAGMDFHLTKPLQSIKLLNVTNVVLK